MSWLLERQNTVCRLRVETSNRRLRCSAYRSTCSVCLICTECIVGRVTAFGDRFNAKRVYRVMAFHALLLPKATQTAPVQSASRGKSGARAQRHTLVLVRLRDQVRLGLGELEREMIIEMVEKRFGHVEGIPEAHALKFL